MAFIVIVLSASYLVFEAGLSLDKKTRAQTESQEEARRAMRLITRYLRQAENLIGDEVTTSTLGFSAELDSDNATTEWLHFYLSGTDLMMSLEETVTTQRVLVRDVNNSSYGDPIFTYYDSDGNEITVVGDRPSDTKRIHIKIITEPSNSTGPYTLETDVFLRNK
jgi:hypothetical protein